MLCFICRIQWTTPPFTSTWIRWWRPCYRGNPLNFVQRSSFVTMKVSFLRGGQGGSRGVVGLLDCWHFFFIQVCIQTKGRQLAMSLQAAAQHRVWCSLADPKICTVPTHQLKVITSLPHVFIIWPGAWNPLENTWNPYTSFTHAWKHHQTHQTQHPTPSISIQF